MVRLSNSGKLRKDSEAASGTGKVAVKLEVEDPVEEECGPLSKRSRPSVPFRQELQHQWSMDGGTASSHQPVQYNPLDEPSPLGLRLRKSPSLLELIQMKLSLPSAASSCITGGDGADGGKKKDTKSTGVSGSTDKLKASNFPASLLRIGSWECVSRYEGDLVAKCYFAKHKLVWEVLDGGLKSKIEIQWSDITALKASCPDNGPGTLDIVLARQPLFFRETNPQPRKHTLWQATSDFTGGQASIHKRHFLQCPPVLLSKHFEKLIQCDPRLNSLSWQQDIVLDSPFFEPKCPGYDDLEETKCRGFDCRKGDDAPSFSSFRDASSTCSAPSTSSKSEIRDQIGRTPDSSSRETPSPISGFDTRDVEEITSFQVEELKDPSGWDQFKVPGLHPSMSMSDLVNHIGNCISEKMAHGIFPDTSPMNKDMLEEITQHLLGDAQTGATAASDENSLMSRVNSLCCLLNPATNQSLQTIKDGTNKDADGSDDEREPTPERKPMFESSSVEGDSHEHKSAPSIARKESVGDLLLHLPRIASLPQFLFNVSEDRESHAR